MSTHLTGAVREVERLTGSFGVAFLAAPTGDATAAVTDILSPKTAYIATGKVTGTCTFDADTSDATAAEGDILAGETAYVAGEKVTGTLVPIDTSSGDAVAADIALGKIAFVQGEEVVGSSTKNADTTDATAVDNSLLYGHTAYGPAGTKLTGTRAYWQYVKTIPRTFKSSLLTGDVELVMPRLDADNALYLAFNGCTSVTSLALTFVSSNSTYGANSSFAGMTLCTSITINGSFSGAVDFTSFCDGNTVLESIFGDALNTSSCTSFASAFRYCFALKNISFHPSSIKANLSIFQSPLLSTASILSIANGLDAGTPKTLAMHATSKTNMDNINVDVVDGVAVLGTTKTLTQFITTDKGWTIA